MLVGVHVGGGCVGEEIEREINSVCFFERVVTSRLLSSSQGQKTGAGLRFQLRDPSSREDKRGCAPNLGVSGNREICGGLDAFIGPRGETQTIKHTLRPTTRGTTCVPT